MLGGDATRRAQRQSAASSQKPNVTLIRPRELTVCFQETEGTEGHVRWHREEAIGQNVKQSAG